MYGRIDEAMLIFFLKLILAHLLGDFVLQPKSWVRRRTTHIGYLFLHVTVHAVLLAVFFFSELHTTWYLLSIIVLAHFAIDSLKIWWETKRTHEPIILFLFDQCLHFAVLGGATLYQYDIGLQLAQFVSIPVLIYLIAAVLIVFVTPVFMRVFFSRWDKEHAFHDKQQETLLDAGLVIGIFERIIVVAFIQVDFLAGIGFLMGAKSIFRFGDLTNAKNTKFTEYVLVGTFLSFAIAIAVGFLLKWFIGYGSVQNT